MIAHGLRNLLLAVKAGACCPTMYSSPEEKTDYLMLEAIKSSEINNTSHFIRTEHPIHRCFEELNGDVSGNLSPE